MKLVIKFNTLDDLKDQLTEALASFQKSETAAKEVIKKAAKKPAPTLVGAEPAFTQAAEEQAQPAENLTELVEASPSDLPTADDVKLAVWNASKKNREAAKAIVDLYAPMASQIPPEKRAEAIAKLEAVQ